MGNKIDPNVEDPVRDLLGHALRQELDDLERVVNHLVDEGHFIDAMTLVWRIAAVVTVELCDGRSPTSEDLQETATTTVEIDDGDYGLHVEAVHGFLARSVFGGEPVDTVLSRKDSVLVPLVVTSNLVASAADTDNGENWYDYLDKIETAIEQSTDAS